MATTGVINGADLVILVDGNAIGHAQSHSLTLGESHRSTTSKDSNGWEEVLEGLRNWSLSGDGLASFDATYTLDDLTTLIINRTAITVRFTTSESSDFYWTGSARLESVDISAPNEDSATYSFSIKGTGALSNPVFT